MVQKTDEEIKERIKILKSNLEQINNPTGQHEIKVKIKILEDYLKNPNMNLKRELVTTTGIRRITLKWIMGDAI